MNLRTRLFKFEMLVNGMPYAFFTEVFPIFSEIEFSWIGFVTSALFFGGFMALYFVSEYDSRLRNVNLKDVNKSNYGDYMHSEYTVYKSSDEILEKIRNSLPKKAQLKSKDDHHVYLPRTRLLTSKKPVMIRLRQKHSYETEVSLRVEGDNEKYIIQQISALQNIEDVKDIIYGLK